MYRGSMKIQMLPLKNAGPPFLLMLLSPSSRSGKRAPAAYCRARLPVRFYPATEFSVSTSASPARWSEQPLTNTQNNESTKGIKI
jgi:hypothetical protein